MSWNVHLGLSEPEEYRQLAGPPTHLRIKLTMLGGCHRGLGIRNGQLAARVPSEMASSRLQV